MDEAGRRAFMKKLAGGVAYSAPVVYSMAAPMELVAQSGKVKGKVVSGKGGTLAVPDPGTSGDPFAAPPPGSTPPGG